MNRDLFQAILAMDAYNRGYNQGIKGLEVNPNVTKLGNATITTDSVLDFGAEAQSAGFYAIAYDVGGVAGFNATEKVVSYRGTDQLFSGPFDLIGSDILNGYGVGALSPRGEQAALAIEFFKAVAGAVDPRSADIALTGHSLGGGLAGLVGSLYGQSATLFNNMAFEGAASNAYVQSLGGFAPELSSLIYGSAAPWLPNKSGLKTIWTHQELLQFNRIGQTIPDQRLVLGNARIQDFVRSDSFFNNGQFALHSNALLVIGKYGLDVWATEGGTDSWRLAARYVLPSLFDEELAGRITGLHDRTGRGTDAGTLATAIAYSAIDEGERPFGDTAIRAMFGDADDLGMALSGAGSVLYRKQGADEDRRVAHGLGDLIVQFAGSLAIGDVEQDQTAENGILKLFKDDKILEVNLSDPKWNRGSGVTEIGYREALFDDTLFVGLDAESPERAAILAAAERLTGATELEGVDRVLLAYEDELNASSLTARAEGFSVDGATLFVAGDGNDWVSASGLNESVILFGGAGNDTLTGGAGNDLLIGGEGQDRLNGNAGDDIFLLDADESDHPDLVEGGDGKDAIDFSLAPDAIEFDLSKSIDTGAGKRFIGPDGTRSSSIEWVIGSTHDDVLKGAGDDDGDGIGTVLQGGEGDDEIHLYNGDVGYGGPGADKYYIYTDRSTPNGMPMQEGEVVYNDILIIGLDDEDELYVDGVRYTGFVETAQIINGAESRKGIDLTVNGSYEEIFGWDYHFNDEVYRREFRVGSTPNYYANEETGVLNNHGEIRFEKANVTFREDGSIDGQETISDTYLYIGGFRPSSAGISYQLAYIGTDNLFYTPMEAAYTDGFDPDSPTFGQGLRGGYTGYPDPPSVVLKGDISLYYPWLDLLPDALKYDPEVWSLLSDDPYPGPPNSISNGSSVASASASGTPATLVPVNPNDDAISVVETETGAVSLNALANDLALTGTGKRITAVNGTALSGGSVSFTRSWGSFTVAEDGTVTYDLNEAAISAIGGLWADERIEESLTYAAEDADGNSTAGKVTVTVGSANDAPVIKLQSFEVDAGNALSGYVRANDPDSDTLTYELVTGPAKGSITFDPEKGRYRYTPTFGASGADSIVVRATDPSGSTSTGTISFNIKPATLSMPDRETIENAPDGLPIGAVRVSADTDAVQLTYRLIDDAGGRFTIDADGVVSVADGSLLDYEAAAGHNITVGVSDGTNEITQTFSITVDNDPTDDGPIFNEILGTNAAETLNGTIDADHICGLAGDDWLYGKEGDDHLEGGDGTDRLEGGSGADILDGGANPAITGPSNVGLGDYVLYHSSLTAVTVDLAAGIGNRGDAQGDRYIGIENVAGSEFDDELSGDDGSNDIFGQGGNDVIRGAAGADDLRGYAGADTIYGGDGADAITVEQYDNDTDTIFGEAGNDFISAGNGDFVNGGDGDDQLQISGSNATLIGGSGNDTFNFSVANTSNTILDGGDGFDVVSLGDRSISVSSLENVELVASSLSSSQFGVLTCESSTLDLSAATFHGLVELKIGTAAGGILIAPSALYSAQWMSSSELRLSGNVGSDQLVASSWNDRLTGNAGNDTLDGGAGTDVAVFNGVQSTYTIMTSGGSIQIKDNDTAADGNDGIDTLIGIETAEFKGGASVSLATPIVLDLDGDGVDLVDREVSGAKFDLDGDGVRDKTGWVGSGDGILVFDRNGDGKLSGVNEISFANDKAGAKSDLDGLSAFDSNGDGRLDARDLQFASFKVWRDQNGDGKVDNHELISLAEADVSAIGLAGTATNRSWGWDQNIVVNTGGFIRNDGSHGALADVALNYASSRRGQDRPAAGAGGHHLRERFDSRVDMLRSLVDEPGFARHHNGRQRPNDERSLPVRRLVEAMAGFGGPGAAHIDIAARHELHMPIWATDRRLVDLR